MIDKEKWDADWDDIIDPTEPADYNYDRMYSVWMHTETR